MKWTRNIPDWIRNMTPEQPNKAINPYAARDSVGGSDAFVGRIGILQAVQNILKDSQQQAITLFGQRRIGKTFILRQLEDNLPKQGLTTMIEDFLTQATVKKEAVKAACFGEDE